MRRKIVATGMAVLAVGFLAVGLRAQEQSVFKSQREKVSYGIGVQIAKDFKQQGLDIDVNLLAKGMKDGLAGGKLLMTEQEMMATLNAFQTEMNQKHAQAAKTAGDDSKKTGEAFLAANKKKEGVVALPSGLQYQIVKAGTGPKPSLSDKVECHYRGTLINGTEFDSSYKRGQPATFPVSGVIRGWTEALQLMPVGSKWKLFVPSNLAYGERGAGGDIGPNETLIFEVELLGIK